MGHHIAFELTKRAIDINLVVRSTQQIEYDLGQMNVFEGDFGDKNLLLKAAQGCNAIIHVAAATATHWLTYAQYEAVNVTKCETILQVATELNIQKIVFISTSNTIGNGNVGKWGNESNAIAAPFDASYYAQSKLAAENLFVKYAEHHPQKHIVVINPCFLIGAYDTKPSSGKLLLMGKGKRWLWVPSGGKNFVAAADVAMAACNALKSGRSGQRYVCGNQNLSFVQIFEIQNKVLGQKQQIFVLPTFIVRIVGWIGDVGRRLGLATEVCTRNINQLLVQEYYDSSKAQKELKMPQTLLQKAIEDANAYFDKKS